MNLRRLPLAAIVLAVGLALAPTPGAAETCSVDSFGDAVDESAAELRAFSAETQPKLKERLQALRDRKGWTEPDYETKGLKLVHDKKLDAFDAQAGELLSKIDALGTPDASDSTTANPGKDSGGGAANCANLDELKAASSELMAVMRAKSAYLIARIDQEVGSGAAAPPAIAEATPPAAPSPSASPSAEAPPPQPDLSPIRKTETARIEPPPALSAPPRTETPAPHAETPRAETPRAETPSAEIPPPLSETPPERAERETPPPAAPDDQSQSSWDTTTAQAVIPPPPMRRPPPNFNAPPPGQPYQLPPDGAYDEDTYNERLPGDEAGYTIDEIHEVTRGFFGTISTSLASVIEHAFQKGGRPTAYVLGNEGGAAFLAGLRYGEGTMYLRAGGTQQVYWHGPSIGYDVGAEGSRTLYLIYNLEDPNGIFRRFTGVDGSAYLVGGVGMTLLKGGPVLMAPIRAGLGLRLGASIGYVRFTPRPTWNPF